MCRDHIPAYRGGKIMILEEETYEKFGYHSFDLGPQSHKKILVACDECGKIREVERGAYRVLCKSCGNREPKIAEKNPNWKGGKIERICQICDTTFKVDPNIVKKGQGLYCSKSCAAKSRKGKNSPLTKPKIKCVCETCGKVFEQHLSRIKRGWGKYCSQSCKRKNQKFPQNRTKPELIFEEICNKYNLPFKYTGDGSFWIGKNPAINPDFVECNGKKIAIEIFSYWHNPLLRRNIRYGQTYRGRKEILKRYKWVLVVFWQEDLERKDAEQFVLNKLKKQGIM